MTRTSRYDAMTEFDAQTSTFRCRHCGCPMAATQGFFADAGTPEANFATAFTCSGCGHALDALVPAQMLGLTPDDDPMIGIRLAAAFAVQKLFAEFQAYHIARAEWEVEVATWERGVARRNARTERQNHSRKLRRAVEQLRAINGLAYAVLATWG